MVIFQMFYNIPQKKLLINILMILISLTNRVFFTCIWTKGTPSDVYSPESLSGTYLQEIDHRNLNKKKKNLKYI